MFYEHLGPVPIRTFEVKLVLPGIELRYRVEAFDFIGAVAVAQQEYLTRYEDEKVLQKARWHVSLEDE